MWGISQFIGDISLNRPILYRYSEATDVWSYAVTLAEVWQNGDLPYPTLSNQEVLTKVTTGLRISQPPECPDDVYSLMKACWAQNDAERPKFSAILVALGDNGLPHEPKSPLLETSVM